MRGKLMNKKLIPSLMVLLMLSIGILINKTPLLASAQEENPDNTPTTTEKLKERIEKIVEQRKDKVEKVLGETTSDKKGFVGQVVRVSETTFTLDVYGTTRIVPFDETVELTKNGKKTSAEDVSVDDWATVMGFLEDDSISPRKIILDTESPLPNQIMTNLGSLKEINSKSIEFQSRSEESNKTIIVNSKTKIENYEGEEADLSQFVEEDQVLIVGYIYEDEAYATTIRALAPFTKE
jgi:hypothetical protein